jgi:hypothetical protein
MLIRAFALFPYVKIVSTFRLHRVYETLQHDRHKYSTVNVSFSVNYIPMNSG